MTYILSKEERSQIVDSHKKNLAINKYNVSLNIIEEEAKSNPDSATLTSLNTQVSSINAQLSALDAELSAIAAEPDTE